MPRFSITYPGGETQYRDAEQFHVSDALETWPPGIRWGRYRSDGPECYVVDIPGGDTTYPVRDGDWVMYRPDGSIRCVIPGAIISPTYTRCDETPPT